MTKARTLATKATIRVATACVALASWVEPAGAQPRDPTSTQGDYEIGPGDSLQIIVWRNDELTMPVLVRPDGWISFPLLNEIRASGMTPGELQKELTDRLEEFVASPLLSVVVTEAASQKVSVLGRVRAPGRYALVGPTSVLEALALAGGPDDFADTNSIYVLRPDGEGFERIAFDYSAAAAAEGEHANLRVRPGDIVFVP